MMDTPLGKRRNFLLALGLGGLGAATARVAGKRAPTEPAQADAAVPAPKGYHLTEHVNTYYRKARL